MRTLTERQWQQLNRLVTRFERESERLQKRSDKEWEKSKTSQFIRCDEDIYNIYIDASAAQTLSYVAHRLSKLLDKIDPDQE